MTGIPRRRYFHRGSETAYDESAKLETVTSRRLLSRWRSVGQQWNCPTVTVEMRMSSIRDYIYRRTSTESLAANSQGVEVPQFLAIGVSRSAQRAMVARRHWPPRNPQAATTCSKLNGGGRNRVLCSVFCRLSSGLSQKCFIVNVR